MEAFTRHHKCVYIKQNVNSAQSLFSYYMIVKQAGAIDFESALEATPTYRLVLATVVNGNANGLRELLADTSAL